MLDVHPLRTWRKANKTRLADLAGAIDVSPSHISQIETGKKQPSLALAAKLSQETEIPLDKFVKREAAE